MYDDPSEEQTRMEALGLAQEPTKTPSTELERAELLRIVQRSCLHLPHLAQSRTFLHQHPLESLADLTFSQALSQLQSLNHGRVWPELSWFRQLYHRGSIELGDLRSSLRAFGERMWPRSSQHTQAEARLLQELFADPKQLREELREPIPPSLGALLDQEFGTSIVRHLQQTSARHLRRLARSGRISGQPLALVKLLWTAENLAASSTGTLDCSSPLAALQARLSSMGITAEHWPRWCEWALWLLPGWSAWLLQQSSETVTESSPLLAYLARLAQAEQELAVAATAHRGIAAHWDTIRARSKESLQRRQGRNLSPSLQRALLTAAAAQEIWLEASERAWRRQFLHRILHQSPWLPQRLVASRNGTRPEFQGLFCIDPRCEPLRTVWEQNASVETQSCPGSFAGMATKDAEERLHATNLLQMLHLLAWKDRFARLVLICGHSHSHRDPWHAAYLECTACAGHPGSDHARQTAALLNEPKLRPFLVQHGIRIPDDTFFLAGVYHTDRRSVELLHTETVPPSHAFDLERLTLSLQQAQAQLQAQLLASLHAPSAGWSFWSRHQRQELAGGPARHAAFLIGPRSASAGLDLEARVFLHSYEPSRDPEGTTLARILSGSLQLVLRINLHYYLSTVDPKRWGAGPGERLETFATNYKLRRGEGDLVFGLPEEALRQPQGETHEPLRLQVFVVASGEQIRRALASHPHVAQQLAKQWFTLTAIDPDSGQPYVWQATSSRSPTL